MIKKEEAESCHLLITVTNGPVNNKIKETRHMIQNMAIRIGCRETWTSFKLIKNNPVIKDCSKRYPLTSDTLFPYHQMEKVPATSVMSEIAESTTRKRWATDWRFQVMPPTIDGNKALIAEKS